jgi:hypothetical protein
MSVSLLDVNVLIALFDPRHVHHEHAHRWFERNRSKGWASCPVTANGFVRIFSNPKYPGLSVNVSEVTARLREFCSASEHEFWPDSVSLLDDELFRPHEINRHQDVTDTYLLGLATRRHGKLATFDRKIAIKAVIGASSSHLELIASRS